ncbi:MAG: carboxypeptidase-like regulatory domain-containing protein [Thermoplasmatota archaeon]
MMPRAAVLAALLALTGCADPGPDDGSSADAASGFIDGVVVDSAIRPLAGVAVRATGQAAANATTDGNGTFRLGPLPLGAYAVSANRTGYIEAVLTANAVADGEDAPVLKLVLEANFQTFPYVETFVFEGYIECGTSSIAVCAVPNFATLALCDTADTCMGNVTADSFNVNHVPEGVPDWVQSELVWTPTVDASDRFYFSVSHYTIGEESELETVYNSTRGTSPLLLTVPGNASHESGLGVTEGYRESVFSAAIDGTTPPGCELPCTGPGFAVQQRFTIYTHFFYHYQPPQGWRFTESDVPPPPTVAS